MSDDSKKTGSRPGEPKIHNADVPSETAGLPETGDGASARHYLRDVETPRKEADTREPVGPDEAVDDSETPADEGRGTPLEH